jgi:tetratricopeptide (TPR) repeat protein
MMASSRVGVRPVTLAAGLWFASYVFLAQGQRGRAEAIYREIKELAERSGQVYMQIIADLTDSLIAAMDGKLEESEKKARQIYSRGEKLGDTRIVNVLGLVAIFRTLLHLGKAEETLKLAMAYLPLPYLQVICLAYLGKNNGVEEILDNLVVKRPGIGSVEDETPMNEDSAYLRAAVMIGHRPSAELLLNRLSKCGLPIAGLGSPTSLDRILGGAAALLERYDEARNYYRKAIQVCTDIPFRPELALAHLELAELLLEHYPDEKKEALEHLDFAVKEFREMKMQPSLERALRHKDILKA